MLFSKPIILASKVYFKFPRTFLLILPFAMLFFIKKNLNKFNFISNVLVIIVLCFNFHASAMYEEEDFEGGFGYTPLSPSYQANSLKEAYVLPSAGIQQASKSLALPRKSLAQILRIQAFDPSILLGVTLLNQELNFEGLDISFCTQIVGFYSEIESERKAQFETRIKHPLLQILKDAAGFSYKFPQTLKFLYDPSVVASPLLDAALVDIFTYDPMTLKNLAQALKVLEETDALSKEEQNSLFSLRKIAGYFYDRKALEYIKEELSNFFNSHSKESLNFTDPVVRFALLRILQLSGEFLKILLPSTLNLNADLPEDTLLQELRDQHLSHITRRKLRLVMSLTEGGSGLFEALYDDVKSLATAFEDMYERFPVENKFASPSECWMHIKKLPEERRSEPSKYKWKGLRGLRDFFTYLKKPSTSSGTSQNKKVEGENDEDIVREAKLVRKILSNVEIEQLDTLHRELEKALKRDVNKEICEEFWSSKAKLKEEQEAIFKKVRKLRVELKEKKNQYLEDLKAKKLEQKNKKILSTALDKFPNEKLIQKARKVIQELSLDEEAFNALLEAIRNLREQIAEEEKVIEQEKEQLKQRLTILKDEARAKILSTTPEALQQVLKKTREARLMVRLAEGVKPTYGHKNLTDTFRTFCKFLNTQGVPIENDVYRWNEEVLSPVEQLFYQAHHIPIASRADKDKHRYEKVREFIRIINFIKQLTKVNTDLRLEIEKEAFQDFVSGKSRFMSELLHKLKGSAQPPSRGVHKSSSLNEQEEEENNLKSLWLIQEELPKLASQITPLMSSTELEKLSNGATEKVLQFLSALKESKLLTDDDYAHVERELKNRSRFEKKKQITTFIKKEQVKSDPRPNEPLQLSKEVEKDVRESQMQYLTYEFLIAAFYELFKEVNDYPELAVLRTSDKVRNFFFHTDPFNSEPLIVGKIFEDANIRINNRFGQLAKEVTILTINTKFLLEEFLLDLTRSASQPKPSSPESPFVSNAKPLSKPGLVQPREFKLPIKGKHFSLREVVIPGNGDCGYLALGTTRNEAAQLLLSHSNRPDIRALVAHEIEDMFATLPDEMKHEDDLQHPYQEILAEEDRIDHQLSQLLSSMNDLIERPEGDRWSENVLFEHYSTKATEKQLNEEQQEAFKQLKKLQIEREQLGNKKHQYCNDAETFKEYVTFYIKPSVIEYLTKHGESNWLNASSTNGRTSSADALANLMGKNLIILNENGQIEHEYYAPNTPIENTLFLLHIGNWHFNKLNSGI